MEYHNLFEHSAGLYEDYKNLTPPRAPDTFEWFFQSDKFCKWRDSNTSSLLWISAGPGCGKSVLVRALIDEKRLSTNVTPSTVCYFFFKDGDERCMYATDALCAILHQLSTPNHGSGPILPASSDLAARVKNLPRNISRLWRTLVDYVDSPATGEVVCVLDALDECNESGRWQLINKLKEFYCDPRRPFNSTSKLKILITSRPHVDLFERFSGTTVHLHFGDDKTSEQFKHDIDLVIDAKIDEIARDLEEGQRRMISGQLKSMEHRTHLCLRLSFDIIEQNLREYGIRTGLETILSELPSTLLEAYEKILRRCQPQIHTETLLQIVLAAARPLSLDEANIALTIALQKERFISHGTLDWNVYSRERFRATVRDLCGSFVIIYDSRLWLIHQTAREFLTHPGKQGQLNIANPHSTMSLVCMELLSYLSDLNIRPRIWDIDIQFSLAQYSARHWMGHARYAETDNVVQEYILKNFLQKRPGNTFWLDHFDPYGRRDNVLEERVKRAKPLYYASLAGLRHTVELLLENGADVNACGGRCESALEAASAMGHEAVVRLLIENGADVNIGGGECGSALEAASAIGHEAVVRLLMENGANVNAQSGFHGNALQAASYTGSKDVVQLLLDSGADVNAPGGKYGSALQAASYTGSKDVVQLLLDSGANVNAPLGKYGSALQAASCGGYKDVVQMLLDSGADVNVRGGLYGGALQAASTQGHDNVVQLLLHKRADVNSQPLVATELRQGEVGKDRVYTPTTMVNPVSTCREQGRWEKAEQPEARTAATAETRIPAGNTEDPDLVLAFMTSVFEDEGALQAMWFVFNNYSTQMLESHLQTLLEEFMGGLGDELRLGDHDMASIFGGSAHFISCKIAHGVQVEARTRGLAQVSSNGGEQDSNGDSKEKENANEVQRKDNNESGEYDHKSEIGAMVPSELRSRLSSSSAFQLLLDNIYDLMLPSFGKRLVRLLERWKRDARHSDSMIQVERVVAELAYSQPNAITISQLPPGWSDQLKGFIEQVTDEAWDWWPLGPRLKPLQVGQVRIIWKCKCDRTRNAVVPREFAMRLKKLVHRRPTTGQGPGRGSQPAVPEAAHLSSDLGHSTISQTLTSHSLTHNSSQSAPDSSLRPRRAFHDIIPKPRLTIFFLAYNGTIYPWSRGLKRSKIYSAGLCDNLFYAQMREEYWKHRGWWRKWLGLYSFEGCDFYLFKRYRVGRFRECMPDLPDQQRDEYEYRSVTLQPQVSCEEFRDGYWYGKTDCPSSCGECDGLERIPQKKLATDLDDGPSEFWGIVAREEKAFFMVLIYTTLAATPIVPSLWFFFKWLHPGELADEYQLANHRDNLSNAFVPLGISIALLMMVLTCVK